MQLSRRPGLERATVRPASAGEWQVRRQRSAPVASARRHESGDFETALDVDTYDYLPLIGED